MLKKKPKNSVVACVAILAAMLIVSPDLFAQGQQTD
jgi:hypothetical protein